MHCVKPWGRRGRVRLLPLFSDFVIGWVRLLREEAIQETRNQPEQPNGELRILCTLRLTEDPRHISCYSSMRHCNLIIFGGNVSGGSLVTLASALRLADTSRRLAAAKLERLAFG